MTSSPPNSVRHPLCRLIMGDYDKNCELGELLEHLEEKLRRVLARLEALSPSSSDYRDLAPFLGRSILELSLSAILGRLDPFRLLVLREVQRNGADPGERIWSAIQWSGDIIAEEKPSELWNQRNPIAKFSRALLGAHYECVFWRPALEHARDVAADPRGKEWGNYLRNTPDAAFIPRLKQILHPAFSAFSKHVHHEHLLAVNDADAVTLQTFLLESRRSLALLGFVASTCPQVPFFLPDAESITCLENSQ